MEGSSAESEISRLRECGVQGPDMRMSLTYLGGGEASKVTRKCRLSVLSLPGPPPSDQVPLQLSSPGHLTEALQLSDTWFHLGV